MVSNVYNFNPYPLRHKTPQAYGFHDDDVNDNEDDD